MGKNLKRILDKYYKEFDFKGRIIHDPISFPHKYKESGDIETTAFISASFAYGNAAMFMGVIESILSIMGESPYRFLMGFDPKKHGMLFKGIKYRFQKEQDIVALLHVMSSALKNHGNLKSLFMKYYKSDVKDVGNALTGMIDYILGIDTSEVYGRNIKPRGFLQMFPLPEAGSACKRLNLFMRWMVRDKDIDFGLWKEVSPSSLIIPLDTHIARVSRCLGLTKRKSTGWKTAIEITESLKGFDPDDPLKYDFALCHLGISGRCNAKKKNCMECEFKYNA